MTKVALLALTILAALAMTPAASPATVPSPSMVWKKVEAQWTAQAHAKGQSISCKPPYMYRPSGIWSQVPKCEIATADTDWPIKGELSRKGWTPAYRCLYQAIVRPARIGIRATYRYYDLNVCRTGWLQKLPRLG